jgi:hypothetical protein
MDRTLGKQEQEKVRAARANHFQQQHKRKFSGEKLKDHSTSPSTATSEPQLDETSTVPDAHSPSMSSGKRFKFPGMTSTAPSKSAASKDSLIVRFYDPNIQARDAHDRTQEQILSWPDNQLERCHNYIQMLFPVPEGSAFNWEAPIIDRATMDAFRTRSDLRGRLQSSFLRMLDFYGFKVANQEPWKEKEQEVKKENVKAGDATESAEEKTEDVESADVATETSKGKEPEAQDATTDKSAKQTDTSSAPSKPTASPSYTIIRGDHWRKSFNGWAVNFDHNHLRITRILRCLRILGLQKECDAFFAALKEVYEDPKIKISDRSMSYWTRAVSRPLYIAPDDDRIEWLREWEKEQEQEAAKVEGQETEAKKDGEQ